MQLSFRLDKRPGESHLALDGKKRSCSPSMGIVAGVRSRRSILTSASVTFVFLSAAMRRTGMPGWEIPMASGGRDGLACANTNSSRRLLVSPRKDNKRH